MHVDIVISNIFHLNKHCFFSNSRNLPSSNWNFSVLTLDVSPIFWQRVVQPRPKYSYCIFLKGLCWVSVCWVMNNSQCSISGMFSTFYFVPHCANNIWHHICCVVFQIYIIIYNFHVVSIERECNLISCSLSK